MQLTELNELVNNLAKLRRDRDSLKVVVEEKRREFEATLATELNLLASLGEVIATTQTEILTALQEAGNKSWRTDAATITRKSKVSYKVVSKEQVLKFLTDKGLADEYTTIELAPHSSALFEQVEVPGVEKTETEYISVLVKGEK
jgi:hypothetical protein